MDEDNIIEIETTSTYETYRKLFWLNLYKGKSVIKKIIWIYSITGIWGIIATILAVHSYKFSSIEIICSLILIILCIGITYIGLILPKKRYIKAGENTKKPTKYRFAQDYFNVEVNTEDIKGSLEMKYSRVHKIYETDKAFYVYTSKANAFILEKKDIKSENLQSLRRILQNKVRNMYFKKI